MNYSINVTVYVNNTPMIYRVTQTGTDKYYAISATGSRKGFTIKKGLASGGPKVTMKYEKPS